MESRRRAASLCGEGITRFDDKIGVAGDVPLEPRAGDQDPPCARKADARELAAARPFETFETHKKGSRCSWKYAGPFGPGGVECVCGRERIGEMGAPTIQSVNALGRSNSDEPSHRRGAAWRGDLLTKLAPVGEGWEIARPRRRAAVTPTSAFSREYRKSQKVPQAAKARALGRPNSELPDPGAPALEQR
jgi:hypothetical protein